MTPADISVVIPALNEQETIGGCIESVIAAGGSEIIVADGGSHDATVQRATAAGATKVIRSLPGRGIQLNSGAIFATGEIVLFLHADNLLGADCLEQICAHQASVSEEVVWGAFRQRIDSPRWIYRWLETGNALRVKWRAMPFGDQAIFVRRSVYKHNGGFAEVPLMEDVAFSKQMRQVAKPILLPGRVTISARRWEQQGVVRQTLRNWTIQVAYRFGVSPLRLAKWYRNE